MTNYFVKNVPGDVGSDVADGLTDATAFASLGRLDDTAFLAPGDNIYLKCGSIFAEQMAIRTVGSVGGTAGNPITYTSYGTGTRPIISAADIPTGWVFDSAVAGGDRYKKATLGWTPSYLFREDGPTIGEGVTINLTNAASLVACTPINNWWYTGADLYVVVATGEAPNVGNITIHVGRRNFCVNEFVDGQDYITFRNISLRFTNEGSTYACIALTANSVINTNWVIDNCLLEWGCRGIAIDGLGTNSFADTRVFTMTDTMSRFHRTHGASVIFATAGSRISNSGFYGNGNAGLGLAARNTVVSGCSFSANAGQLAKWSSAAAVSGFNHGLYVVGQVPNFDRSSGNTIQDCLAYNNAKGGFATDALSSRHVFIRCSSWSNTLYGWQLEGGTTNSSSSNTLVHCSAWSNKKSGLHVVNCHGPFDARNNQFYGNGKDGSQDLYIEWNIGSWDYHSGTTNTDAVYRHGHNECDPVNLSDQRHSPYVRQVSLVNCQSTASSYFFDGTSSEGTIYVRKFDGSVMTNGWVDYPFTIDYNNYTPLSERPTGHAIYRFTAYASANSNGQTMANLRSDLVGKEAHGMQLNPVYVDAPSGNFALMPGSPSIDTGVVIANVNNGGSGSVAYLGTLPDLGAVEYDESTSGGVWVSRAVAVRASALGGPRWVKAVEVRKGTDR